MCGICGVYNLDGSSVDRPSLLAPVAILAHRGPDASDVRVLDSVGFGHTRLSVIDLSGGRQPMSSHDGTLWITFNGEIFNYIELRSALIAKGHRFLTESDTEVVLEAYRAYGENCVHHFNGQWAFAIWDATHRKLFLSRDRFGVRPLFYIHTPRRFLFASEIKALCAFPEVVAELNPAALNQIFTYWVIKPPHTAFKNVFQIPPGHSVTVENGRVLIRRYWQLHYDQNDDKSESALAEELFYRLQTAVQIRLRSDVPVGAYLSGGIDSTVITALTSRIAGGRLRTFSVSFEDAEFDESYFQRMASAYIGTHHTDVHCRHEDIAALFPEVIWHIEQPVLRTAPTPLYVLSRHVRNSGYKVVLTGEGADEMLGGYDIFKEAKIRRFWGRQMESKRRPLLLKRLYPYMGAIQRQSLEYLKQFFHVTPEDIQSPVFSHLPRWEMTSSIRQFLSPDIRHETDGCDPVAELIADLPDGFANWDSFNQAEFLEAAYLLPGYLLSSQGDRMAMANSVEARYPFLDHHVVEFAARLPVRLKMKGLDQKHLLKVAGRGLLPEPIRTRAKQPYRAPDAQSFFGPRLPEYLEDSLASKRVKQAGVFNADMVSALISKFRAGRVIGTKDNMAMVGILSTHLVLDQFVHHNVMEHAPCMSRL